MSAALEIHEILDGGLAFEAIVKGASELVLSYLLVEFNRLLLEPDIFVILTLDHIREHRNIFNAGVLTIPSHSDWHHHISFVQISIPKSVGEVWGALILPKTQYCFVMLCFKIVFSLC